MAERDTGVGRSAAGVGLGERLLSGTFRGCCLMMRAAARCCGVGGAEEASGPQSRGVDLHALALLGVAPLAEIAAAQREFCAWDDVRLGAEEPPVEARILPLPSNKRAVRPARIRHGRQRTRRAAQPRPRVIQGESP